MVFINNILCCWIDLWYKSIQFKLFPQQSGDVVASLLTIKLHVCMSRELSGLMRCISYAKDMAICWRIEVHFPLQSQLQIRFVYKSSWQSICCLSLIVAWIRITIILCYLMYAAAEVTIERPLLVRKGKANTPDVLSCSLCYQFRKMLTPVTVESSLAGDRCSFSFRTINPLHPQESML